MLQTHLHYDLPVLQMKGINGVIDLVSDIIAPDKSFIILVRATLSIGEEDISGYFILLFEENSFNALSSLIERQLAPR